MRQHRKNALGVSLRRTVAIVEPMYFNDGVGSSDRLRPVLETLRVLVTGACEEWLLHLVVCSEESSTRDGRSVGMGGARDGRSEGWEERGMGGALISSKTLYFKDSLYGARRATLVGTEPGKSWFGFKKIKGFPLF